MSGFLLGIAALNPAYASTQPTVTDIGDSMRLRPERQRLLLRIDGNDNAADAIGTLTL